MPINRQLQSGPTVKRQYNHDNIIVVNDVLPWRVIAPPFHRLFNVGALTGDLQKSQPTLKRGAQGERLDGIERCCLSAKNYFTTNLLSSYGTRSTLLSFLKTKRCEKVTLAVTRTYA